MCHLAQTFQIYSEVNNFKKKGSYNCEVSKFENILILRNSVFLCGGIFSNLVTYSEKMKKKTQKSFVLLKDISVIFGNKNN